MLSFDQLTLDGAQPIYVQIIRYIKQGIAAGTIANGEELPSRRAVSALLGVNPNTVQKAYRMLEEEGLIQSHSGAKSRIVVSEEVQTKVRGQLLRSDAETLVAAMKQMGVTKEETLSLLEILWKDGDTQ
ncbi:MAG: GntR family transcriptional regulator [Evtepia sp.]|uniref:GntR family transcriptional regulator n=1 Tax=Evtepia sp. TaxID=2773933 RepID=UPI002A765B10|nr:GntR family transcriptional regulator [Evtepia sp.]MDY3014248.1 GntR family transcriptional regulator [Evtepia sp.]